MDVILFDSNIPLLVFAARLIPPFVPIDLQSGPSAAMIHAASDFKRNFFADF